MTSTDGLSDAILPQTLKKLQLTKFWCKIKEYPQIPEETIKILFPFPTTYLCGCIFFIFFSQNNRLTIEADMRIQLPSLSHKLETCKL